MTSPIEDAGIKSQEAAEPAELSHRKVVHTGTVDAKLAEIRALQEQFRATVRTDDLLNEDDLYDTDGLPK